MRQQRWSDADVVEQITLRWWFGRMIGNTDMHFGNLSFFLDDTQPLTLYPCYDMLPMLYRPAGDGSLASREFSPAEPLPATLAHWQRPAGWASTFWQRVAQHTRVTAKFASVASDDRTRIERIRQRFG
jgi:hypothetical protein